MVKKSISVTEQQDHWIQTQIRTGHFGNEGEIIRELIRQRQLREQETPDAVGRYRLSKPTEEHLIGITLFGDEQFGIAQSNRYRDQLERRFSALARSSVLKTPSNSSTYCAVCQSSCRVHLRGDL